MPILVGIYINQVRKKEAHSSCLIKKTDMLTACFRLKITSQYFPIFWFMLFLC